MGILILSLVNGLWSSDIEKDYKKEIFYLMNELAKLARNLVSNSKGIKAKEKKRRYTHFYFKSKLLVI
jgi:hypothetical protein